MRDENQVVYLIIYQGDKLPPYYIGSTYSEIFFREKNPYYGSPQSNRWKNIFKQEFKDNFHLFDKIVLQEHNTRKESLEEELRLHKLFDVIRNPLFYNEQYACKNGCFGNSETSKYNLLGKPSHCKNRSWYNNGINSKMFYPNSVPDGWVKGRCLRDKITISERTAGITRPNYIWVNDGNIEKKIHIQEFNNKIWVKGRLKSSIIKMTKGRLRKFKWYSNDELKKSIRIYEDQEIPIGYYLGRTYYKLNHKM